MTANRKQEFSLLFQKLKKKKPKNLDAVVADFSEADALRVKEIERTTNHDVKAVEYFLPTTVVHFPGLQSLASELF